MTAKIFEVFARKTAEEVTLIKECLTSDNPQAHFQDQKGVFNKGRTVPEIVADVCALPEYQGFRDPVESEDGEQLSDAEGAPLFFASTVRDWLSDFEKHKQRGFSEDMRGKYDRVSVLEEWGLAEDFNTYLRVSRKGGLSVDKTYIWLNEAVAAKFA